MDERAPWPNSRWTDKDWFNETLFDEYIEATRTALQDLDADFRSSWDNRLITQREDGSEEWHVYLLIGVWSPLVSPKGGFLITVTPYGDYFKMITPDAEMLYYLVPTSDMKYQSEEYKKTNKILEYALDSEYFYLKKRLKDEGILPVKVPSNSAFAYLQRRASKSSTTADAEVPAWERIPDHNWDRAVLKYWLEGYTCGEIHKATYLASEDTIRNRLSILRGQYGTDVVPTDKQRRKLRVQKM